MHFLEHEWTGEGNITIRPTLHSERDLLHPHKTREHKYKPSAHSSSSSSLAGPDNPNLVNSPSNSSYFTAVVVQPTLSSTEVNSGKNIGKLSFAARISQPNRRTIKQKLEISQLILLIGQIYQQNKGRN
jgi:hypothetical protein